jgi:hypothetical protein
LALRGSERRLIRQQDKLHKVHRSRVVDH